MANRNMRLDIQGLRALAVLSVVIFHISPYQLTGGYLGVDIFFVISGYLIMGQIWRALNEHRFSFTDFYIKRFKRLLPALVVVLIVSSIAAYFLLLPGEYRSYTLSVFSSLFYFSNFWFYTKSGYFDAELQTAPLLHTWSLSVEEQFYFIFPFLLVFLYKACSTTKKALVALMIIAVFTLLLSESLLSYDQSLSFYASPTRFWQFIVGGLLAISKINAPKQTLSQILSLIGLVILVFVIFVFDDKTPFPGFMAIPVTLATALVIYARSEHGMMGWVLSNPISNFFGNISYSFYLWHWPVIIFYKIYLFDHFLAFEKFEKLSVLITAIILATLTYRFIEIPFKKIKYTTTNYKPILLSLSVTLGVTLVALGSSFFQKMHFTQQTIQYESYLNYKKPYAQATCFLTTGHNNFELFDKEKCIKAKPGKFNILLIGDSHAEHWFSALQQNLQENQTLSLVTASGCKPLLPLQGLERCTNLMNWAMNDLIVNTQFNKIIIAGRWKTKNLPHITKTIARLKQSTAEVLLMGPVVEYQYPLPILLAKFADSTAIMKYSTYKELIPLNNTLAEMTKTAGGDYFSTIDYMCNSEELICQFTSPTNIPMQFDYGHLTHEGAVTIMAKFSKVKKT